MPAVWDRLKASMETVIKGFALRLDYLAFYRAQVVSQSADGLTVDLQPEDKRLPSLSAVPIRLGIPGAVAKVQPNSVVMLGFENGDPARPIATLWGESVVTELDLSASLIQLNGGSKEVARKGDHVNLGTLTATAAGGLLVTFVFTNADGIVTTSPTAPLSGGKITEGAAGVKA